MFNLSLQTEHTHITSTQTKKQNILDTLDYQHPQPPLLSPCTTTPP